MGECSGELTTTPALRRGGVRSFPRRHGKRPGTTWVGQNGKGQVISSMTLDLMKKGSFYAEEVIKAIIKVALFFFFFFSPFTPLLLTVFLEFQRENKNPKPKHISQHNAAQLRYYWSGHVHSA